jgi:CHAT domain-containing protein/tetratricopeptide (TPR) repeat protein
MRVSKRWRIALLSIFGVLALLGFVSGKYVWLYFSRRPVPPPVPPNLIADPAVWNNPKILLAEANQLSWVWNWPRAEPLYARAEQLFQERGDARDETYARVGWIRAQSQSASMSWVDVSELLGRQLELPVVKSDPKLRLWCLAAKGYTDLEIDPESAKRAWTEARRIAKSLGEPEWEARATGELGTIAFLEGDNIRAGKMVGSALLSAMASGDEGEEVRSLEMLGNGFVEVHRYAEALDFFDHAIKIRANTPDAGFPFMAYEGRAQALAGEGRLEAARGVLNQVLAIAEKNENWGHETEILVLLGELSLRTGNPQAAKGYLEQAGQIGREHRFYRSVAEAMLDLARLYRDEGDLKSAEDRAAIGVDASRRVGDRYYLPRDLTVLADLRASGGHVRQANALYEQAEDVIDGMLVNLDEPYWSSSLAGAMSETYSHHFELLARTGAIQQAFDVLERVRGRTAAALLENRVLFRKDESPRTQALDDAVSELQLQLMRAADAKERERLKLELFGYERELAWTENDSGVSDHDWLEKPAPLEKVQAILRPDEVVLEYVMADPYAYCFWITRSGVGLAKLPAGRGEIEKLTRAYIDSIRGKNTDAGQEKELYTLLIAPVPGETTHDRLIIVPDGPLYFLPFGALRDPRGKFLVQSRTISYVPAATVLEILKSAEDMKEAPRSLLAVGDVPYQDQGNVAAMLPEPKGFETQVLRGLSDLFGTSFSDLPETRKEVLDVKKIIGNNGVVLLGSSATEAAFESEPLADFKIVHLAVHGFADLQFPERSGLLLGASPNAHEDGLLEIPQVMRLHFNADLVTLSACDTGVGKVEGEEGITNLAEAFLVSGARAVVASLWSVDDTFTRALMDRFYTHLAQGQDTATALREAKLDMLAKYGNQVPPFFWGAFVLIGDGGSPIPLRGQ